MTPTSHDSEYYDPTRPAFSIPHCRTTRVLQLLSIDSSFLAFSQHFGHELVNSIAIGDDRIVHISEGTIIDHTVLGRVGFVISVVN